MFRLALILGIALCIGTRAEVITQWTFNSPDYDFDPATGTFEGTTGFGQASAVGSTNISFGTVASGGSSDPSIDDNTQIRVGSFPSQGTANKTRGLQFLTSTVGFENISVWWDHYNSGSASRYWRVQYSVDGSTWLDHEVFENSTASAWLLDRSISFNAIPGANNNPNFGIRILSEFESTATGSGVDEYKAVTSGGNYSTSGTLWIDMVTIHGDPLDASNQQPTISLLEDISVPIDMPIPPVMITIGDAETSPEELQVTYELSNDFLMAAVELTGDGSDRVLTFTPFSDETGNVRVTLRVTDGGGKYIETSFQIEILPDNAATPETFALWNFNSVTENNDPESGTFDAAFGAASALIPLGDVTAEFGTVSGGNTSDPVPADNSMLRLGRFPSQGTGNKSAGVEIRASTEGYENIVLTWDHYNSNTASRYWRIQYTVDGINYTDYTVFPNTAGGKWHLGQRVRFRSIPDANNNLNFGIRIVSEFHSTAAEGWSDEYLAVNDESTYSGAGTFWIDTINLAGQPMEGSNTEPTISEIQSQTIRIDSATPAIPFTISDFETPAENLTLGAVSSRPELVQNINFEGTGTNRSVTVTPEPSQTGEAVITIRVTDEGNKYAETSFTITVLPSNTAPAISVIPEQELVQNGPSINVEFTLADAEETSNLTVSAATSNPEIIPVSNLIPGGTGTNRSITFTPAARVVGMATIELTVSDGQLDTTRSFLVRIIPTNAFTIWNFNSNPPDDDTETGLFDSSTGFGFASILGNVTGTFGATGKSSDTAAIDNSMVRLGGFPAQGTENKENGMEFRTSTLGWRNISFMWDHYNSNTGSRYWRIQYTTNGYDFHDFGVFTNDIPTNWRRKRVVSFASVPAVNDNPDFGIRLVTEFESTATGSGEDNYKAVNPESNYGTAGTFWIDMVTISGDQIVDSEIDVWLTATYHSGHIHLAWPVAATEYQLESSSTLHGWELLEVTPEMVGENAVVIIPTEQTGPFFRLRRN